MNIQPINLPVLIAAIGWPVIVIAALIVFRIPIADLTKFLSSRVRKFSFGGFSLELAELPELRPSALDIEVRQLDACTRRVTLPPGF